MCISDEESEIYKIYLRVASSEVQKFLNICLYAVHQIAQIIEYFDDTLPILQTYF